MKVQTTIIISLILIQVQYYLLKMANSYGLITEEKFLMISKSISVILLSFCISLVGSSYTLSSSEDQSQNGGQSNIARNTINRETGEVVQKTCSGIGNALSDFVSIIPDITNVLNFLKAIYECLPSIKGIWENLVLFKNLIYDKLFQFGLDILSGMSIIYESIKSWGIFSFIFNTISV